ncbi:MAG TPA: BrnT family toxin [Pyrinomonadaceae bacterium]
MRFEWDEEKNRENIRKHLLDFADAWEIFDAPMLANLDVREDYGEARWIGVGFLKNFVAVIVYTESDDVVRVISLRKALKHERTRFEEALGNELGEGE